MEGGRRAEAESSSAAARAPPESSDDLAEDAKGEFDVGDDEDDGDNEVGRDERGTRCRWVRSVAADSPKGSGGERQAFLRFFPSVIILGASYNIKGFCLEDNYSIFMLDNHFKIVIQWDNTQLLKRTHACALKVIWLT
ncbi:hypothetical protein GW17_00045788 [Ensete ventricosum]|nr:hypothetical protein GW17_00045788 [Ensete ventricosum]